MAAVVWQTLDKEGIEILPGKCKGPSKEVKILDIWLILMQ